MQRDRRASDAERQTVVRRLERALREGRLTIVEFDERTQAAYAARTRGELEDLTEDLPRDLW
ncbi:MAG: putative Translation initiation factor [Pseudonocardia sp.]|nr:putative Translation initiation factor [Pseudonocardia sp.]